MPDREELQELPLQQLLKRLSGETTTLVRQEFALAKAELAQKVVPVERSAGMLAGTAALGVGAFGAFTATVILALALVMPAWLAALIITVVYGIIAVALAMSARKTLVAAKPLSLDRTMDTVKEDLEWAKTRTPSSAK
jgi:hypothetical protein